MTITWENFINYLQAEIYNKEGQVSAASLAKYNTKKQTELTEALNKIKTSWENSSNFFSNNFHSLPLLTKTIEVPAEEEVDSEDEAEEKEKNKGKKKEPKKVNKSQIKDWTELFPRVEQTILGAKSNKKPFTSEIYHLVKAIYQDWKAEEMKIEYLEDFAEKWKDDKKGVAKYLLNVANQDGIMSQKIQTWLDQYYQLKPERRGGLRNQKKGFKEFLKLLEEARQEQKELQKQKSWWGRVKSFDWWTIGISSAVVLIILLVIFFIWRTFRRLFNTNN